MSSFNLADSLEFLEEDELYKFGVEIVTNSGDRGITDDEADNALRRLHDWLAIANFIRLWRDGLVTMKWRSDLGDLVVRGVKDPT
jgi:hypothetical protein